MRPVITYDIGSEFTAVSLQKQDFKAVEFPLKLEKPEKDQETDSIKPHLVEVAKIVQFSSKSKD
jgi:hypothetical protein